MTAYTIPEEIVGVPLFVPSGHDYFSIESAALPNGQDALRIRGDTSPTYLAFQRGAQTPSKLQQWTDTIISDTSGMSMSFWIKVTDPGTPSGILMSCKDFETGYSTGSIGVSSVWARWWITISEDTGQCVLTMNYRGTANGILSRSTDRFTYGAWHLIVFSITRVSGTNCTMGAFTDKNVGVNGAVTSGSSSAILSTALITMISLGSYQASYGGTNCDHQLGKWTFHDHLLNRSERALMYDAMMKPVYVTIDKDDLMVEPMEDPTVTFNVHFSEPVTGFGIADVTLSGSAGATTVGVSGIGADYIVTVSGMTTSGTIIANIPAGVATSMSGALNEASTSTDNVIVWIIPLPPVIQDILDMFGTDLVYLHWYAVGSNGTDHSLNGRTGTLTGITPQSISGPDGETYPDWGGGTDMVSVADHGSLSITTTAAKTFFAVIRPANNTANMGVIDKRTGSTAWEYRIWLHSHDAGSPGNFKMTCDLYTSPSGAKVIAMNSDAVCVPVQAWSVIAVAVPGYTSSATATPVLYVDGTNIPATKVSTTNAGGWDSTATFYIGNTGASPPGTVPYQGSVAYSGCVTGVRTAGEMAALAAIFAAEGF